MTLTIPADPPKKTKRTPADVLRSAARVIEERGWYQGGYEDPRTGAVCALGAINLVERGSSEVDSDDMNSDPAVVALWATIGSGRVPDWNDSLRRTEADVIAALRTAADRWERIGV